MAKAKRKPCNEVRCPDWMVTMGDCMSLLVTFFVLLLTFSTVNEDQLMELMGFINGAMNTVDDIRVKRAVDHNMAGETTKNNTQESVGVYEATGVRLEEASPVNLNENQIQLGIARLNSRLQSIGFEESVTIRQLEEGVAMRIKTSETFEGDSMELTSYGRMFIGSFAELAARVNNEIRITIVLGTDSRANASISYLSKMMNLPIKIGHALSERSLIDTTRIAFGVNMGNLEADDFIELMLVDKIHVFEVDMKTLAEADKPMW